MMKGYHKYIIAFLLILIILPMVYVETASAHLAENSIYYQGYNALSLSDSSLSLNSKISINNTKDFSLEAQNRLFNLASQFDRTKEQKKFAFSPDLISDSINLDRIITYDGDELQDISFKPSSDFFVDADYKSEIKDIEILLQTSFNINYQLNKKTTLRAGYDLMGRKWENPNKYIDRDNIDDNTGSNDITDPGQDGSDDPTDGDDNSDSEENTADGDSSNPVIPVEPIYNSTLDQQGRVGISYQTSNNLMVSADYIKNNIFRETEGDSTILGLEYVDDEGKLKARYEIIHGKGRKETITGLELDLKDLASFSASYKLLDPQFIKDKLDKESVWDFGVDINLSQATIFSIDYQLIDNNEKKDKEDNIFKEKESNINASFKVKF